jgi:hypothetical protein
MRRLSLALVVATTLLVGLATAPVTAATKQPVGSRINLFQGNQTFAASTAFHIDDGWGFTDTSAVDAIGKYSFALDVDGSPRVADFVQRSQSAGFELLELWFFNFASGLTGTHTFTGHFLEPCNGGSVPCNGNKIHTPVETLTVSATVTFS